VIFNKKETNAIDEIASLVFNDKINVLAKVVLLTILVKTIERCKAIETRHLVDKTEITREFKERIH
jgi:hypothetical protein